MRRIMFLLAFVSLIGMQAFAQTTIAGKVTDADGQSVPGANVRAKGYSDVGTITDLDGNYSLSVPDEATTLIYSFVGMASLEVEIAGQTVINATLEAEDIGIDEVVVTALGITRQKKGLGYAVQKVGGEELNQANQSDALSALSGRVAGVEVRASSNLGGSSRILIRGANSITGQNQPLIVVDGVPMDNSSYNSTGAQSGGGGIDYGNMLNDIDPSEIQSMSVLKGPAAALYGSRAANGVIIITTKKGKAGKSSFSIDYSSSVNFEQAYMIPKLQRKYGGGAIIGDGDGGVNGFAQQNINGTNYSVVQYAIDESWGPKYDPSVNVLPWYAFDQESFPQDYLNPRPWVAPDNDVLSFYDIGVSYVNSIGVSKSASDYGMRFAYTNTNTTGALPGSSQKKNALKFNGNATLTDWLSIDANLNFTKSNTEGRPEIGYGGNSVGQKFFQWGQRQLDFEKLKDFRNIDGTMRTWNRVAWDDATAKYSDNPYWTVYQNSPVDERTRFFGNIGAKVELMDGLTARGNVYGDTYTFYIREKTAVGSQSTPEYYEAVRQRSEFNFEGIIDYAKQFESIGLTALAGVNRRVSRYDFNRGRTSGGLVVPGVYSLLNSVDDALTNDETTEKKVNSVFGSVSLDYNGLIYLEASVRNDWSSTLPEDNNSYFYPSASLSFLFSELLDLTWFDMGKVRAGWSQVGNDTDPYNVVATYEYNTNGGFQSAPRLRVDPDLVNTDLKPEKTTSMELGIELAMFVNRISLNATYFDNKTVDQILPLELSKATGYESKWINAGEMSNKGFEIALGVVPVKINDFSWSLNVNFTKVKNEVIKLYEDAANGIKIEAIDIVRAPFGGVFLRASEGDTYGQLWGTDFIYDDAGNKVVGTDGHWMQTPNLVPMGSVLPDYNMGIRNTLKYKGFDMSFLFDIQQGGKFYSLSHMWGTYSGMMEESAGVNDLGNEIRSPVVSGGGIKLDGVTADVTFDADGNVETVTNTAANTTYVEGVDWAQNHYHRFGYPSAQSVFNANYIKLREITFGYTLPKLQILNGAIKSAHISVYGRNLMTFGLDKEGFDPEMTVGGSGNIQGLEGGLQPLTRTFGFSIKLGF